MVNSHLLFLLEIFLFHVLVELRFADRKKVGRLYSLCRVHFLYRRFFWKFNREI
ncbi:hypothetical protein GS8_3168 [Geobacillus stearothermophilus]|uniref:Uncharacterized protein n=1 Tax=Geobacillus stearothermophilus TaxID=1422 RepID=A0ABQ7HBS7_GEOSE|nr:hypothetical protein GS8_3168 [Geobacillus stearothermophilus]